MLAFFVCRDNKAFLILSSSFFDIFFFAVPGFLWYRPLIPFSESTRHKFWLHCVKQSNQSFFNTFAGVVIWQEPFKTLTVLLVTRCCAPLSAVSNTHWVNNVFRCVYTLGKNFQPQSIETNSLWYNREWIPGFVKVVMLSKLFSRVLKKKTKKKLHGHLRSCILWCW